MSLGPLISYGDVVFYTLVSIVSWVYLSQRQSQVPNGLAQRLPFLAVVLHSVHVLCQITLHRPPNLFRRLKIPINTPSDQIKSILLLEAGFDTHLHGQNEVAFPPEVPQDIDLLLRRLAVLDSRALFARFGQRAMQTCRFCSSAGDYILFNLPSMLLQYLPTAALLLLLTTGLNGRERLRSGVLCALVCAYLAEGYVLVSASAMPLSRDSQSAFMWHDNFFVIRHALFLVLPLLTQFLPPIYAPAPPSVFVSPALTRLERILPRAHLLRYCHEAVMRRPELRQRVVRWWTRQANEGETAMEDEIVQRTADKLGFGFRRQRDAGEQEGKLRLYARKAVESWKGLLTTPV